MSDLAQRALELSAAHGGKISVESKVPLNSLEDLAVAYTPGVAAVSSAIANNKEAVYQYTSKRNLVAVVTDGSAVLGLGNIGPEAAIPVMEGKAALFKRFANVDAVPLAFATQDSEEIIAHIKAIAPSFGGVNLEDISAPRCFEIEARLKEELDIPVFHDDQHGTAIVVLAALINALKLTQKSLAELNVVINGAGAAGTAIAQKLKLAGVQDIIICDREGILSVEKAESTAKQQLALATNPRQVKGSLTDALKGADVFVGVSGPKVLKAEWIPMMAEQPIVFALANPEPEILPDEALAAGAYIVATGRSDFANQINNVLAFPGIFRGALDARAKAITDTMQIAAAYAIADIIPEAELKTDYIIPDVFNPLVAEAVADSVRKAN